MDVDCEVLRDYKTPDDIDDIDDHGDGVEWPEFRQQLESGRETRTFRWRMSIRMPNHQSCAPGQSGGDSEEDRRQIAEVEWTPRGRLGTQVPGCQVR